MRSKSQVRPPRPYQSAILPNTFSIVRVRPLTAIEASRIPEAQHPEIFYGDGALGGSSPSKTGSASPAGSGYTYGGSGLWREVVGESEA